MAIHRFEFAELWPGCRGESKMHYGKEWRYYVTLLFGYID